jgi:hypothetical protein
MHGQQNIKCNINRFQVHLYNFEEQLSVSSCLSGRTEQLSCHYTEFQEILYLSLFRKSLDKSQVPLKSVNNNGTVHEDQHKFLSHLAQLFS